MSSRIQIIATIGPACDSEATIGALIAAGMDIARINFSHGTDESNGAAIRAIRAAATHAGKRIPIIADLPGPRAQTDAGHAFDNERENVTAEDRRLIGFCVAQQVDYFAQSYVGSADDVATFRTAIAEHGVSIPIIAKIERQQALDALELIIAAADAVMVARGDLGEAIALEEIPFAETACIDAAHAAQKPVIVATQMLFSMTDHDAPTRAEVTDVAFAVLAGADAIMLSDETAKGKFPVESVAYMERIASRAERDERYPVRPF